MEFEKEVSKDTSYRDHARHFLSEAVHQAQTSHDLVCLRLAEVEQAAIDADEDLNPSGENDSTDESKSNVYILQHSFLIIIKFEIT